VRGKVDAGFVDVGEHQLKNISRPTRVYAVDQAANREQDSSTASSEPPRLSITVLPFANFGGGSSHDHFVDGLTESLTTDLTRIEGSLVIARNTAFTFKGRRASSAPTRA